MQLADVYNQIRANVYSEVHMETNTIETARFLKRTIALSIETLVTETLNNTNNTA
jgi:hypothetical protein